MQTVCQVIIHHDHLVIFTLVISNLVGINGKVYAIALETLERKAFVDV